MRHTDELLDWYFNQHRGVTVAEQIQAAVLAEREACAQMCDAEAGLWGKRDEAGTVARSLAESIRARGLHTAELRECNACSWAGPTTECVYCGEVGPLCPMCHETTMEADCAGAY